MIILMMYSEEGEEAARAIAKPGEKIHYNGNIPFKLDANSPDDTLTLIDLKGDGGFQSAYSDGTGLGQWLLSKGLSKKTKHIEIIASDNNSNHHLSVLAYKLILFLRQHGYDVAIHVTDLDSGNRNSILEYKRETKNWQLYEVPNSLYYKLPPNKIPNLIDLRQHTTMIRPIAIQDIRAWTRDDKRTCGSDTCFLPPLAP
jgi:hypothetical protein